MTRESNKRSGGTKNIPEIKITLKDSGKKFFGQVLRAMDVAAFARKIIGMDELNIREHALVIYLNRRNQIIGYYHLSIGGTTGTVIDTKFILAIALKSLSTAVILVHNHPSQNPSPSIADKDVTLQLIKAGEFFGIRMVDHIILSKDDYFSFTKNGLTLSGIASDESLEKLTDELEKLSFRKAA